MKRLACLLMVLILCFAAAVSRAFEYNEAGEWYTVQLIDNLATRSGPGTQYTGCGSYNIKGQNVTAIFWAYDKGGVLWVEIIFDYKGASRRAWTGAKRLNITSGQLQNMAYDEGSTFLGQGTVRYSTTPRFGPGVYYAPYDRTVSAGTKAWVITYNDGFAQIEFNWTNGEIFRCWIPEGDLDF